MTSSRQVNRSSGSSLTLAVTPSVKLRPAQAKLYEFILAKYKANAVINLTHVIKLYTLYGNRHTTNGTPYYYRYDWQEHREHLEPLKGDLLRTYAVQWFIHNLGIFVVKGLLTAIPTLELSEIQIEAEATEVSNATE